MQRLGKQKKLLKRLEQFGVIIDDPDAVWTEGKIKIGRGTRIKPDVFLTNVEMGKDCIVGPQSEIIDSKIGNRAEILFGAQVKRSILGDGCMMHHHSYLGDAVVGKNVNIAAGVITCNYDGKKKHKTIIGDNAFIGSNVNLIAPNKIGRGCYIAAGSTLKSGLDTGENNLIICREEGVVIRPLKNKKKKK